MPILHAQVDVAATQNGIFGNILHKYSYLSPLTYILANSKCIESLSKSLKKDFSEVELPQKQAEIVRVRIIELGLELILFLGLTAELIMAQYVTDISFTSNVCFE